MRRPKRWTDYVVVAVGWAILLGAVWEMQAGERIRDGVYYENIFPGYLWSVIALGYAFVGLLLRRAAAVRWSLLPVTILSAACVFSHRLFLDRWVR